MAKIIADYHMHTTFSPDGFDSPEAMCRAALEKGLTEIAVTDHFEFYQAGIFKDKPFTIENMLAQQRELDKCREMFSGKLTIRSGIEIGQPQCNPQAASELMASVSFDYASVPFTSFTIWIWGLLNTRTKKSRGWWSRI